VEVGDPEEGVGRREGLNGWVPLVVVGIELTFKGRLMWGNER
jgi:hypothetical protein